MPFGKINNCFLLTAQLVAHPTTLEQATETVGVKAEPVMFTVGISGLSLQVIITIE